MKNNPMYRFAAYSFALILLFLLEKTPSLLPSLGGANLVPSFLVCIAIIEGAMPAAVFGFFCGLIFAHGQGINAGFTAAFYTAASAAIGIIFKTYMRESLLSGAVCAISMLIFQNLVAYAFYFAIVFPGTGHYFWITAVGQIALSMLFYPPTYWTIKALRRRLSYDR